MVKVVIVGPPPYGIHHGENQQVRLRTFLKQLKDELNVTTRSTDLRSWREHGIAMLPILPKFTTEALFKLCELRKSLVFILFDEPALEYQAIIRNSNHNGHVLCIGPGMFKKAQQTIPDQKWETY